MRRERLYLEDIVAAADAIAGFLQGHDAESYAASALIESAVERQLMIIGEAAARVSAEFRARHPEVPWRDIVGFRNQVVHQYFGLNREDVWSAATNEVPVLRNQVAEILRREFPA